MMKRHLTHGLYVILLLFSLSGTVFASVETWNVCGESPVFFNFSANHDYYSRDIPVKYSYEAKVLSAIRQKLVGQKRIQNVPVIFRISSPLFGKLPSPQIVLEKNGCLIENEEDEKSLGMCYIISLDNSYDFPDFLVFMLALQKLTDKDKIIFDDPIVFKTMKSLLNRDISTFQNVSIRLDVIPSPDRRCLAYVVWERGGCTFKVSNADGEIKSLEPLFSYPALKPIWSLDSRYLAYASLKDIKIFDTRSNRTTTVSMDSLEKVIRNELLMVFIPGSNYLIFAFDTNLFSDYDIFVYKPYQPDQPGMFDAGKKIYSHKAAEEKIKEIMDSGKFGTRVNYNKQPSSSMYSKPGRLP
jgi:hypothetical protein